MPTLKQLRTQIEKVDAAIIKKLAKRQLLSKQIGKLKQQTGKKILNTKREDYLMRYYARLSKQHNIQEIYVQRLFAIILKNSRRLQKK